MMTELTTLTTLQNFTIELLNYAFDGCGFDSDDIQQLALTHNLIRAEIYDPEVHTDMQGCKTLNKGDKIYLFNDVIKQKIT